MNKMIWSKFSSRSCKHLLNARSEYSNLIVTFPKHIKNNVRCVYQTACLHQNNVSTSTFNDSGKSFPVQMAYTSFKSTSTTNLSSSPPILIMHGLLGSKMNWKSLAKVINQRTGRIVYTVDARNHGESPHTDVFTYYSLGEDIVHFLKEHSIPKACLIGHSMGGRAVMTVALHNPDVIEKLFVLDISPVWVSDSISMLPRFVEVMRKVCIPAHLELPAARKFVDILLQPLISEPGIRLFLLANLMKQDDQFYWRVNLDAIAKQFNPHLATFPPVKDGKVFEGETHFIGGELSNYLNRHDEPEILKLFPNATFSYIKDAGHWIHADQPHEFLEIIIPLIVK